MTITRGFAMPLTSTRLKRLRRMMLDQRGQTLTCSASSGNRLPFFGDCRLSLGRPDLKT